MSNQPKLFDVEISPAQAEAEHYATMLEFARLKMEELRTQAELVVSKMAEAGQKRLSFRDEHGTKHFFEVVHGADKLKYAKREEPEA